MAYVKDITSKQLFDLHNVVFQSTRLHNALENAGQTLWSSLGLPKAIVNAHISNTLEIPPDSPDVDKIFGQLQRFHREAFTGLAGDEPPVPGKKFPKQQLQQYLSVVHEFLPQSEDFSREAIRHTLQKLKLGSVLKKGDGPEDNQLKPALAELVKSLDKQKGIG